MTAALALLTVLSWTGTIISISTIRRLSAENRHLVASIEECTQLARERGPLKDGGD